MNDMTMKRCILTICLSVLSAGAMAQSGGSSPGVPAGRPPQEVMENTTALVGAVAAAAAIAALARNSSTASNH